MCCSNSSVAWESFPSLNGCTLRISTGEGFPSYGASVNPSLAATCILLLVFVLPAFAQDPATQSEKLPKPKPVEAPPAPPVAAPAPPAPPAPAPVTPPSANAAYLKNPAPEYPQMALRRGWEGTVLLRVEVLASGKPGQIQVQKSSGRQALDAAALAAVKRWSFVPAKQGDVAQAGWVSVPIDFKLR